ncbi:hypothetical protein [Aquimarina sp. 2-A2]|uniref:hypothetical protein n=1 Tax=Aquimarina sp. 2-A2 TaxID=3382644 RepID=UPI00388E39B0
MIQIIHLLKGGYKNSRTKRVLVKRANFTHREKIRNYIHSFSVNEALHLLPKEEEQIKSIVSTNELEYENSENAKGYLHEITQKPVTNYLNLTPETSSGI